MKQELKPILEAKNIKMYFSPKGKTKKNKKESYKNYVKANDDISLAVYPGETLSVVGESGCGKSTFGRAITKLYNPTDGQIIFDGKDITKMGGAELRDLRTEMQFIFQDPYSSLTPTMTVSSLIGEAMMEHGRKKFNKKK